MRRLLITLLLLVSFVSVMVQAEVVKVLPFLLDTEGRISKSPSLFDRDAYQAYLRIHTNDISGIRYDVQWKADKSTAGPLKLRVELRGVGEAGLPKAKVLETEIAPGTYKAWTDIKLTGDDYKNFGSIVAWRTTLWSGTNQVGAQQSFLW